MKALMLTSYGLNIRKKLKFLEQETKKPGPKDVLIAIHAAGLNPVDYKMVYGMALPIMRPKRPFPLGFDLAGTVIAKGNKVKNVEVGDEIYSKVPWDQMGTFAQEICVRSDMLALKPRSLSFEEAAGIPLVGCTVVDAFEVANIQQGSRVLIIGASGGSGTFAVQYAKYLGAYVLGLTSTPNIELVKGLGADKVIDYKQEDFRKIKEKVDVVFDTVGGRYPSRSISAVKRGGKIISIAGHHDNETLKEVGIAWPIRWAFWLKGSMMMLRMRRKEVFYKHVWSYPNGDTLRNIASLIDEGHIRAVVDRAYPFEEAIEALEYLQRKRAKGKVIVKMRD